jgi:MFS family permease
VTHQVGIFRQPHQALTIGIILAVTMVAFEGLAVTTVAPNLAQDLHGIDLFGWVFSAYLLAQLTGTVLASHQINQRGPALPFIAGLVLFGLGLVITAFAPNMPIALVGRALQGFGAGVFVTCIYSSIFLCYEDALRVQILAVFSASYVIPALIGPYIAGVLAVRFTWRLVFWGLLPFLLLATVLTLPTFLRIKSGDQPNSDESNRFGVAIQLAIGTGLLLTGLGQLPQMMGVWVALAGLLFVVPPLRKLLPAGTFVAYPGLPAVVASRGLFVASYFGLQTFLVFALTTLKERAPDTAGLVVAVGTLSWSTAAWLQARLDRHDGGDGRRLRVQVGIVFMLVGAGLAPLVIWIPNGDLGMAVCSCILLGFGIGLAHPTSGAIAFNCATKRSEGAISADLQIADTFTPAISIGLGGALLAMSRTSGWALSLGVTAAFAVQLLLIIVSLLAASRLPQRRKA